MVSHETEKTELSIEKATKRSSLLASLSFHRDASATVCSSICATFSVVPSISLGCLNVYLTLPFPLCGENRSTATPCNSSVASLVVRGTMVAWRIGLPAPSPPVLRACLLTSRPCDLPQDRTAPSGRLTENELDVVCANQGKKRRHLKRHENDNILMPIHPPCKIYGGKATVHPGEGGHLLRKEPALKPVDGQRL